MAYYSIDLHHVKNTIDEFWNAEQIFREKLAFFESTMEAMEETWKGKDFNEFLKMTTQGDGSAKKNGEKLKDSIMEYSDYYVDCMERYQEFQEYAKKYAGKI